MIEHFGLDVVHAYMGHVQNNAEESVRRVLDVLTPGAFTYPMDDGSQIAVEISIDRKARSARVDFTGTSPQLDSNFNAPTAVCRAAVLYVFRSLVDADIPLNEGCLEPIDIVIPEDCMLNPKYPAAVVAGNVETSQCITDALFGALGAPPAGRFSLLGPLGIGALMLRDYCVSRILITSLGLPRNTDNTTALLSNVT